MVQHSRAALAVWDFTLSVRRSTDDHKEIMKELEQIAKKWVFQKEDGSLHETEDYCNDEDEDEQSDVFDEEDYFPDEEADDEEEVFNEEDYFPDEEEEHYSCDNESDEFSSNYSSEEEDEEEEDEGYIHYQGKISLMKRRRLNELVNLCKVNSLHLSKAHWSPSSNNGLGQVFYCMKLDTRIAGPWQDTDEPEIVMPRQLRHIKELRPWQQEICDRSQYNWNPRTINWIYDPV